MAYMYEIKVNPILPVNHWINQRPPYLTGMKELSGIDLQT